MIKHLLQFEATGNIPTVEVSFEKTAVEAGTRRLAAKWSVSGYLSELKAQDSRSKK